MAQIQMAYPLRRILCVDDEEDILQVAKLALETVGRFETRQCSNGADALIEARKFHPDVILLDVMMPQMDGLATLKALKQDPAIAGIPVIFMTAKVQPSEVKQYLELGAIGVVAKPFDPMELSQQVKKLWTQLQVAHPTALNNGLTPIRVSPRLLEGEKA